MSTLDHLLRAGWHLVLAVATIVDRLIEEIGWPFVLFFAVALAGLAFDDWRTRRAKQ